MPIVPTITALAGPFYQASTFVIIGYDFGRVVSVALTDDALNQYELPFHVDSGSSIHATIPNNFPEGSYGVLLSDIDNNASINMATDPAVVVVPNDPFADGPPQGDVPTDVLPSTTSEAAQTILQRTRMELGDYSQAFQAVVVGDGFTSLFDLPADTIDVTTTTVSLQTTQGQPPTLVDPSGYTIDPYAGTVLLDSAVADQTRLIVTGNHWQFFIDADLFLIINSAALKHTNDASSLQVWRDLDNFKHYLYSDQTVDTLRPVEYAVVALLAAYEALSIVQADAAYDIDVSTSEGTSLPRSQRFSQIAARQALLKERYDELCMQLGVGLARIEVFTLRRVSRTTGRLVPVYVDREYDDVLSPPIRTYAPRNAGLTGSGFDAPDPYAYGGTGVGGYP
jgi:hypothetical protein